MVSTGTVVAAVGVIVAGAVGGVLAIQQFSGLAVTITPTTEGPSDTISYTVKNGTPGGYYTLGVQQNGQQVAQLPVAGSGTSGSGGVFDSKGSAAGTTTLSRATNTLAAGSYAFAVTDSATSKTATASFTLT